MEVFPSKMIMPKVHDYNTSKNDFLQYPSSCEPGVREKFSFIGDDEVAGLKNDFRVGPAVVYVAGVKYRKYVFDLLLCGGTQRDAHFASQGIYLTQCKHLLDFLSIVNLIYTNYAPN